MRESNWKGLANHPGPESWGDGGNVGVQALTGEGVGRVSSREIDAPWPAARDFLECRRAWRTRKATPSTPLSRGAEGLHAVRDPVHAPTHRAREPGDPTTDCSARGSPHREVQGLTPMMNGRGKSD